MSPSEMRRQIHEAMPQGGPLQGLVFSHQDGFWEFTNSAGRAWHHLCAPDVLDATLRSRLAETMALACYEIPSWRPEADRPQLKPRQETSGGELPDFLRLARLALQLSDLRREHFEEPRWQEIDGLLAQIADAGRRVDSGLVPLVAEEARRVIEPMLPPSEVIAVGIRWADGNIDKGLGEWERWIVGYTVSNCISELAADVRLAGDAGSQFAASPETVRAIGNVLDDGRVWFAGAAVPREFMEDAREFHKRLLYFSKRTQNGFAFGPVIRRRLRKVAGRLVSTATAEARRREQSARAEFSPVLKLGNDPRWNQSNGAWLCGPTDNSEPTLWVFPTSWTKEPKARVVMLPPLRLPAAGPWRREDEKAWAKRISAHTTEVTEVSLLGQIRKCGSCDCPMVPGGNDVCPQCQGRAEAKALPIAPEVRNAHAVIAFFGTDESAAHAALQESKAFLAMAVLSGIPAPTP